MVVIVDPHIKVTDEEVVLQYNKKYHIDEPQTASDKKDSQLKEEYLVYEQGLLSENAKNSTNVTNIFVKS